MIFQPSQLSFYGQAFSGSSSASWPSGRNPNMAEREWNMATEKGYPISLFSGVSPIEFSVIYPLLKSAQDSRGGWMRCSGHAPDFGTIFMCAGVRDAQAYIQWLSFRVETSLKGFIRIKLSFFKKNDAWPWKVLDLSHLDGSSPRWCTKRKEKKKAANSVFKVKTASPFRCIWMVLNAGWPQKHNPVIPQDFRV